MKAKRHLKFMMKGLQPGGSRATHRRAYLESHNPIICKLKMRTMNNRGLNKIKSKIYIRDNITKYSTKIGELPIFAYWDSADQTAIRGMITEWQAEFPQFQVLGETDIIHLVEEYFPLYLSIYKTLRIPAAKSDIARILALYKWGGLYVDCHVGIKDPDGVKKLFEELSKFEAIFVDRRLSFAPRPAGEHFLINSIMASRVSVQLFIDIARDALAKLARQRELEKEYGFTPYHVGRLTGPEVVTAAVLQPGTGNQEIRKNWTERILIVPEEALPVERNRYHSYSARGSHWSERQKRELLFDQEFPD